MNRFEKELKLQSDDEIYEYMIKKLESFNFKLYKYCSVEPVYDKEKKEFVENYNFKNLENDVLYYNSFLDFNDPFEFTALKSGTFMDFALYNTLSTIPQAQKLIQLGSTILPNKDDYARMSTEEKDNCIELYFNTILKNIGFAPASKDMIKTMFEQMSNTKEENFVDFLNTFLQNNGLEKIKQTLETFKDETEKLYGPILRTKTNEQFKLTCLSELPYSCLMWSHYASKHQGFVIEYDFNCLKDKKEMEKYISSLMLLQKVVYVNSLPELSPEFLIKDTLDKKYLASKYLELLYTKHMDWSYEKEWRSIIQNSTSKAQSFIPASKIIVGVKTSEGTIKRLEQIAKNKNIEIEYLVIDNNTYSLKPIRNNKVC